jgi:hypothetical protein
MQGVPSKTTVVLREWNACCKHVYIGYSSKGVVTQNSCEWKDLRSQWRDLDRTAVHGSTSVVLVWEQWPHISSIATRFITTFTGTRRPRKWNKTRSFSWNRRKQYRSRVADVAASVLAAHMPQFGYNRKFWEQLIVYLRLTWHGPRRKRVQ